MLYSQGELVTERFRRLGEGFFCQHIGTKIGDGLTPQAAAELGLSPGTVVGVGIIDAHAGGIGVLGGRVSEGDDSSLDGRLAMICGTSTCHMLATETAAFVPGVWGPYYSAMVPGMWLLEGGQSAVGSLLDWTIDSHVMGPQLRQRAKEEGVSIHDVLHTQLLQMQKAANLSSFHLLTASIHVLPYHHGNRSVTAIAARLLSSTSTAIAFSHLRLSLFPRRSPRADSSLLGCVSGLTLANSESSLALLYLATLQSICYADRHIIDTLSAQSSSIRRVILCGGLSRSPLFQQCEADILPVEVAVVAGDTDAMLLGSGMIAAAACGEWEGLRGAMKGMAGGVQLIAGAVKGSEVERFHSRKYQVFLQLHEDQLKYRRLMQADAAGIQHTSQ